MADPNDPKTPPESPAAGAVETPQQPQPGASPASGTPEAEPEPGADAIAEEAPQAGEGEPQTEGDVDAPIKPADITKRDTGDAITHTVPLDLTSVDDVADHVAETFAPEIARFVAQHPGARHFVTVGVHIGGALMHSADVGEQNSRAATALSDMQKLEQFVSQRFPAEPTPAGGTRADVILNLLNRAFPAPAASAGLAAANRR